MNHNRRGIGHRKPKKKPNRYNPNKPDWKAVHAPWFRMLGEKR